VSRRSHAAAADKIEADIAKGVLEVTVPRAAPKQA